MTLLRQATKTANRRRRGILLGLGAVDSSYQGLQQRKSDRVASGLRPQAGLGRRGSNWPLSIRGASPTISGARP